MQFIQYFKARQQQRHTNDLGNKADTRALSEHINSSKHSVDTDDQ